MQLLKFSEELQKLKSKLLVLSGISLFIGLTEALPQKVAILGFDLSQNSTITGWFILAVTFYFLFKFFITAILEIIQHSLPFIIYKKISKTTGDTIGLTADECFTPRSDDEDIGTHIGELKEISSKNEKISYKYKRSYITLSNLTVISVDFVFPVVLWLISIYYLHSFLRFTN